MSLVETEIGSIAPDWKVVRLKDVAEKPQYGLTAKAATSGDIKFLRITDITDQRVNWATVPFCSAPQKKIDTCKLKSGDILFARIGATTGKSYMIGDPPDAVFASYLIRVRVGNDLDPNFLIHFFQSRGYWQQVDANKHANLKKGVNGSILSNLLLPLPPLPEQKKIAHILSTVQRAIEAQERIIQTTTELKKALMHKLFTEGLRNEPQKQTEIGSIPESWEVVEFDSFSTLQRGKDLTKAQFRDGVIPVAGSNGVIGFHNAATCKGPGVTVGRSGSVGKVIFYEGDFWAHNTSLYVREFHGNHPRYIGYFLDYLDLARFKTGASVPTLDRNSFKNMPVAIPSISEQSEIAEALAITDRKVIIATRKRTDIQDLFRTLLHELMTATTRVDEFELTAL